MKEKRKITRKRKYEEVCSNCGIKFEDSQLGIITRGILNQKPACSYECNKTLEQIKK